MKGALTQFIDQQELDPIKVMDLLQDHGICSDECVDVEDVFEGGKCIAWLSERNLSPLRNQPTTKK